MNSHSGPELTGVTRRRVLQGALAATAFAGFSLTPFRRIHAQSKARRGLALCIGLNHVDPNAYDGWNGALGGCENDANGMAWVASSIAGFYDVKVLIEDEGNIRNVRSHIAWAANDLRPGDLFMITFAGHGNSCTDDGTDENDGRDETWCMWDGEWLDDDRFSMWTRFARGVRVLVVPDSCHSATSSRVLRAADALSSQPGKTRDTGTTRSRSPQLANSREAVRTRLMDFGNTLKKLESEPPPAPKPGAKYGTHFNLPGGEASPVRAMPFQLSSHLDRVARPPRADGEDRSAQLMRATVLSLAACQDAQTAADIGTNGAYTRALLDTWGNGFRGNYRQFFDAITHNMSEYEQVPYMEEFGRDEGSFETENAFQVA